MKTRLRDLPPGEARGEAITIDFEGEPLPAFAGEPVAVALHAAGIDTLARSSKYHRARGFFCLTGHCASCALRIDGRPNQRACVVPARDGLACARQNAFPSVDLDLLGAADWLFPEGMDHHTMMTANRPANALFLKVVREMGGSGKLPDHAPAEPATVEDVELDVCVVGGGPAGLTAVRAVAEATPGGRVTLFDEQSLPGGSLLAEKEGVARAAELAAAARAAGAKLVAGATAIAYYPEDEGADGGRGLLAVTTASGLLRVRARRIIYATGGYDQNLPFPGNDRPGVIAARACGRLVHRWGVRPVAGQRRVIVLDAAPTAAALVDDLLAAGMRVDRVDLAREEVVNARGVSRLRGLDLAATTGEGGQRTLRADVVAVAAVPAPASELARQHGARVGFDSARGGYAVEVDQRYATSAAGVFACGDVTGYVGTRAAARAGAEAGRSAAASLAAAVCLAIVAVVGAVGCASTPASPPAATPPFPTGSAAPSAPVEPPPFAGGAPATREGLADARTTSRRAILDAAWRTVRDKHFDPKLGGLDWQAVRAKYEPLAIGAPSDAAFYRVLNQMIGELGQSHMLITGPGAEDEDAEELADDAGAASPTGSGALGDPGLTVRVIDGRPTISRVREGSSADRAGLRPGYVVTEIGGRPVQASTSSTHPVRPVEERFAVRRAAARRLLGPAGTRLSLGYLDDRDQPGKAVLIRDEPHGKPVQLGHLPPLYPEVRATEIGDVGVVSFNIFLIQPVLEDVKKAIARFEAHHVRAVILDLRGNPGGQGAMAIPIASLFVDQPVTLGTLKFRDFSQTLVAKPEMGQTPFTGPLAILTDEGTASAAEMLAAGLQEAKRAVVVGDASLGAVLPSVVESLPGGAVMQYVVADFKTPKGVLLEGRGVQPDRRVLETRSALRTGRDPVLDAALVAVRASRPR